MILLYYDFRQKAQKENTSNLVSVGGFDYCQYDSPVFSNLSTQVESIKL
jgi:hypothetical protein